ncbi:MAG TPA: tail fiber domain-containing protein [Pyrinomonadaceae bacterium]|nr:tail fiber domain-containing protein [Pyrinomonadaceae bacterium]
MLVKISYLLILFAMVGSAMAQTTGFVYQGKLQDSGIPANGLYEFQFKLFDAETGGNQIGLAQSGISATATNGIFAVNLNFGGGAFNSQEFRFLEIGVRPSGSQAAYTTLSPRQQVTSTPYAIRALSAADADHAATADDSANLGGIPAAQYVITTDPRMSDARDPLPNSAYYIQNGTSQQASSNFNISGEGKGFKMTGVFVNATSEFQQGGARVMQFNNAKSGFVGLFTGPNSTGADNMFVGYEAGNANTTGSINTFVGSQSGKSNIGGFNNSFFGAYSGFSNSAGTNNAFFGANAGLTNNGSFNSFFGSNAGFSNTSGVDNSFFGNGSGLNNSSGGGNSFFGRAAGKSVTIAANNSFFGAYAGENTTTGGNAYFGAFAGQKNTVGFGNVFVGINAGKENTGGSSNTFVGANTGQPVGALGDNNTVLGANAKVSSGVSNATAIGANAQAFFSNSVALGTSLSKVYVPGDFDVTGSAKFNNGAIVSGLMAATNINVSGGDMVTTFENSTFKLKLPMGTVESSSVHATGNIAADGRIVAGQEVEAAGYTMTQAGIGASSNLCYYLFAGGAKYAFTVCSSSIRFKENVQDYSGGLDVLRKLRPVVYNWKKDGAKDVGFIAEEVNQIEPLLSTYDPDGTVRGIKYDQISAVLVNAIKEQQEQVERQQAQIDALKALVCEQKPKAAPCATAAEKAKR